MKAGERLLTATTEQEAQGLIDQALREVRGDTSLKEQRDLLRALVLGGLSEALLVASAIDHLLASIGAEEWEERLGAAVEKEMPGLLVDIVDGLVDSPHLDVLRLLPGPSHSTLIACIKKLGAYLDGLEDAPKRLRGMRAAMIFADLYSRLHDPKFWRRRTVPACAIDNKQIRSLKEDKQIGKLPEAYLARINQLQRIDLRSSLLEVRSDEVGGQMSSDDGELRFEVRSPLRLGLSSANASDNHARSKEQGGKTLNAAIDLHTAGLDSPTPPLRVTARRLTDPRLVLRSRSADFEADFEADLRGDPTTQSELFFAYRRGGDESLRMLKQSLVHTGIVEDNSDDIVRDIAGFTEGGGLEITTSSSVLQGSGLGTSSILAASILKILYRLAGHSAGGSDEYPFLYDQSVLLEQSIGLNSGWQDARGACGGASAVKDFLAPATTGLPAPKMSFVEVDEETFHRRVVLFDTGIARGATRGLNVVLESYLRRDRDRYGAMQASLEVHDEIADALRQGDYPRLGQLATRYWEYRCILDPDATNEALRQLFRSPVSELHEGGMLTGAGGGGFALLIAREGEEDSLRECLSKMKDQRAYAGSAVVDYRLNRTGLQLSTSPLIRPDDIF